MEIQRHDAIENDFKSLKRFSAPEESLEAWERLFRLKGPKETPGINSFLGFGNTKVFKGRVVPVRENFGKSKGYRVIFQLVREDCFKILVFSRHGIYHDEQDLVNLVRTRIRGE